MALPTNTATILQFLNPAAIPNKQYVVYISDGNVVIGSWDESAIGSPQPTDQEITDAGNSQAFIDWYAEHGGDAIATLRRRAKEALDAQNAETEALIRALAFVVLDEINILRAEHSLAARTPAQLRTAIKAKITDGYADS